MKKLLLILLVVSQVMISGCGGDDGVSFEEQLATDLALIDNYLSQNNITSQEHESGIRFVINEPGSGATPQLGDIFAIKFESFFLDGSSAGLDTIGTVLVLQEPLIQAFILMLPEVAENGTITIYSPSGYLFGTQGRNNIPPNTPLIYKIELLRVIDTSTELIEVEGEIIDEYLLENEIEAQIHSTGIRFIVLEEGTGASPTDTDNVAAIYEGSFFSGFVFDTTGSSPALLELSNVIDSWRIMLPTMKEGGKIRFYAPSSFCYGQNGNGNSVPPYTTLIFEIELVNVL